MQYSRRLHDGNTCTELRTNFTKTGQDLDSINLNFLYDKGHVQDEFQFCLNKIKGESE